MRKILRVIHQELITTFQRKTYMVIAFGIPVLTVLILAGVQWVQSRSSGGEETPTGAPIQFQIEVEGYVDQSGLVRLIPDDLPEGRLLSFESEEQAQQALASGQITAYYVIPSDYLEKGEIFYVYPETKALISDGQEWVMQWTLLVNLMGGDAEAADRIWNPIWNLESISIATSITSQPQPGSTSGEDCSRPGYACHSNDLIRYLPSILVGLFYVSFMASSSMLFNSIGSEKETRKLYLPNRYPGLEPGILPGRLRSVCQPDGWGRSVGAEDERSRRGEPDCHDPADGRLYRWPAGADCRGNPRSAAGGRSRSTTTQSPFSPAS